MKKKSVIENVLLVMVYKSLDDVVTCHQSKKQNTACAWILVGNNNNKSNKLQYEIENDRQDSSVQAQPGCLFRIVGDVVIVYQLFFSSYSKRICICTSINRTTTSKEVGRRSNKQIISVRRMPIVSCLLTKQSSAIRDNPWYLRQ